MKRLDGKVAIVTGGAGRIGPVVASRLAAEGARVVVADLSEESALQVAENLGAEAMGIAFNAADEKTVEQLIKKTVERYGRIDILHNNHAFQDREMLEEDRTVLDTSFELWDLTMAVNLRGHFAACKYAIPHMIEGGGGSIIHTTSNAALAGDDSRIAYATSKAGLIGFSRYVATQHGKQGIRSNCISPGLVADQALQEAIPEFASTILEHTLTPRIGVPNDIAALVAFLASDESGYITGQCFQVDGGMLSHQPYLAELRAKSKGGKLS